MLTEQDREYKEITKKATRGMGWNYLSFGLSKVLNLVTIAILAHLLSPKVFGIVGLASIAIDYMSLVNDLGLGAAIIQRRQHEEEAANVAFTLNIVMGLTLSLVTLGIAPLAASFFHEPMVTPLLSALGFSFFIGSIGSVHNIRLQRDLNFRRRLISDSGNSLTRSIVSIGLALAGFGVWSLVLGQLIGITVSAILLWVIYPWRPRLSWNYGIARELFRFGSSVMGTNILSGIEDDFDYLLIGRFYNSTALGIYSLAYQLPEAIVINVLWVMSSVLFPTFSSLQHNVDALKKNFLSVVRLVEILILPICLGMLIAAEPLIRVAFGEKWLAAVSILQILSVYALIHSIGFHVGDVYKAIGRSDLQFKIGLAAFTIKIIALWIGAQYSLIGVAFGHLIAGLIVVVIRLVVAYRVLGVAFRDIASQFTAFYGGVALAILALPTLYLTANTPPVIHLLLVAAAGAVGYISVMWWLERDSLLNVIRLIGLRTERVQDSLEG